MRRKITHSEDLMGVGGVDVKQEVEVGGGWMGGDRF